MELDLACIWVSRLKLKSAAAPHEVGFRVIDLFCLIELPPLDFCVFILSLIFFFISYHLDCYKALSQIVPPLNHLSVSIFFFFLPTLSAFIWTSFFFILSFLLSISYHLNSYKAFSQFFPPLNYHSVSIYSPILSVLISLLNLSVLWWSLRSK